MLRFTRSAALTAFGVGAFGAMAAVGPVACEAGPEAGRPEAATVTADKADAAAGKDIVDTATAAGQFKTLAAALKAAGLVDTLKGQGPFTVFAPTDEAFAKLPAGTVESLLSTDLSDGQSVPTVNGTPATVKIADGKVMVGNATVTQADVAASNGVIHVIDTVLMP